MVSGKQTKSAYKKVSGKEAKFAYRKSRSVKVYTDAGPTRQVGGKAKSRGRWSRRSKHSFPRRNVKQKQLECPGAPHNTTSFLINFHKSNSSNDLIGKYCRREVLVDPRDRYEVESVVQT